MSSEEASEEASGGDHPTTRRARRHRTRNGDHPHRLVVVAAVFAFVVLSPGLFSSERGKEAVYAGLAKTRGIEGASSSVIAASNGTSITTLDFDMTLAAGGTL